MEKRKSFWLFIFVIFNNFALRITLLHTKLCVNRFKKFILRRYF